MERTKTNKKPSLILCSDFHLREDTPTCFTGDWHQEQWKAVEFVRHLQYEHKCPVIHAGDLFDHWKPSPALISQALYFLPNDFYTIYGQHDLPQHNWELRSKSGLHTLEVAGRIKVLDECHYGQEPDKGSLFFPNREIDRSVLVWHHLTYIKPPFPGATGGQVSGIFKKYPQFDLIVTGDNHQSFAATYKSYEKGERWLVNPGSLTRQTADQAEFQPRVALWYAETNTIEWVNIPIQKDVITREHIDRNKQRDERIEAFISKLDGEWQAGLSFEQNLEEFFAGNNIRDSVKQIIYKSLEK